jgi:hypothetical protein
MIAARLRLGLELQLIHLARCSVGAEGTILLGVQGRCEGGRRARWQRLTMALSIIAKPSSQRRKNRQNKANRASRERSGKATSTDQSPASRSPVATATRRLTRQITHHRAEVVGETWLMSAMTPSSVVAWPCGIRYNRSL